MTYPLDFFQEDAFISTTPNGKNRCFYMSLSLRNKGNITISQTNIDSDMHNAAWYILFK